MLDRHEIMVATEGVPLTGGRRRREKEMDEVQFQRRDRVLVTEEAIRPWTGTVRAVKPSSKSGIWLEIARDDGGVYVIPIAMVSRLPEEVVA
jgi:hypothetical protein